ncbi:hypothetical protein VTH82DRAFT_5285 [Thermothelomyces myriococcoides]
MLTGKLSLIRPSARLASRFSRPSSLRQIAGRRGYASLQERVAQSSETPWQVAAVAVTVPGLLYLRSKSGASQSPARHGREAHAHAPGPALEQHKSVADVKTDATNKAVEDVQETQHDNSASSTTTTTSSSSSSSSSSDVENAPTPRESSSTEAIASTPETSSPSEQAVTETNTQNS